MDLKEAVKALRNEEKRNFDQSIDLIVNLKGVDMRKDNITAVILVPHKIKEKKVAGFLTKKSEHIRTITQPDFAKFKDKKELKKLIKEYDYFIASAALMPAVATAFGKVLGPTGKMPSPQLGIIMQESEAKVKEELDKIAKAVKIRAKEPSIKLSIGKESMKDEDIVENFQIVYAGIVNALPTKRENVRSVMIKTTMSKPIKVEMK